MPWTLTSYLDRGAKEMPNPKVSVLGKMFSAFAAGAQLIYELEEGPPTPLAIALGSNHDRRLAGSLVGVLLPLAQSGSPIEALSPMQRIAVIAVIVVLVGTGLFVVWRRQVWERPQDCPQEDPML